MTSLNISNDDAKKVLDFLSQRAGYDFILIRYQPFDCLWMPFLTKRTKTHVTLSSSLVAFPFQKFIKFKERLSWKDALQYLLHLSSKGISISDDMISKCGFMGAYESLETILIQMDLALK